MIMIGCIQFGKYGLLECYLRREPPSLGPIF